LYYSNKNTIFAKLFNNNVNQNTIMNNFTAESKCQSEKVQIRSENNINQGRINFYKM